MERSEEEFRSIIRRLIKQGKHPDHRSVRLAMNARAWGPDLRSGLSTEQTRWRIDEIERAGYDWEASKKAREARHEDRWGMTPLPGPSASSLSSHPKSGPTSSES
jgi:hypothetical protein